MHKNENLDKDDEDDNYQCRQILLTYCFTFCAHQVNNQLSVNLHGGTIILNVS